MHRFAVLTAASTLVLIFAGGLVTSTGSGLAVPDWPLSYGQFFPPMVGGVLFEHGHRMVAAVVGVLTLILAVWISAREKRRWVGWLAAGALAAVILQGALGGLTVLFLLPPAVSIAHACLAQTFFCLTVTLAVVTGGTWSGMGPDPETDAVLPRLTTLLTAAVYLQLILGAVMRHLHAGLSIPDFPLAFGTLIPPLDSAPVAVNFAHRVWALVVTGLAIVTLGRVLARHRTQGLLVRPATLVACLVAAQITLGATTVWSGKAVVPTTLHVACGASILAASLVLALRAHRLARTTASLPERKLGMAGGTVATA